MSAPHRSRQISHNITGEAAVVNTQYVQKAPSLAMSTTPLMLA